jgi:hypothetical protein
MPCKPVAVQANPSAIRRRHDPRASQRADEGIGGPLPRSVEGRGQPRDRHLIPCPTAGPLGNHLVLVVGKRGQQLNRSVLKTAGWYPAVRAAGGNSRRHEAALAIVGAMNIVTSHIRAGVAVAADDQGRIGIGPRAWVKYASRGDRNVLSGVHRRRRRWEPQPAGSTGDRRSPDGDGLRRWPSLRRPLQPGGHGGGRVRSRRDLRWLLQPGSDRRVPRRWACSPGRRCGCIWSGRSSPAPSLEPLSSHSTPTTGEPPTRPAPSCAGRKSTIPAPVVDGYPFGGRVADLPTIVAVGPFDAPGHAHLVDVFTGMGIIVGSSNGSAIVCHR